jgi:hypothetical protein
MSENQAQGQEGQASTESLARHRLPAHRASVQGTRNVQGDEQKRGDDPFPSFAERHLWSMRWLMLLAFLLIFIGSLALLAITKNALLVSIPGSLLLAMRPMIRFLFPARK